MYLELAFTMWRSNYLSFPSAGINGMYSYGQLDNNFNFLKIV